MDLPKVTRLVGGRVRTETQAARRHLTLDTAHGGWRGSGLLTPWATTSPALSLSSSPPRFSSRGLHDHSWLLGPENVSSEELCPLLSPAPGTPLGICGMNWLKGFSLTRVNPLKDSYTLHDFHRGHTGPLHGEKHDLMEWIGSSKKGVPASHFFQEDLWQEDLGTGFQSLPCPSLNPRCAGSPPGEGA